MEQLPVINELTHNTDTSHRYSKKFKLKVVREVEEGLSQKEASVLYGMSKMTVRKWLQSYSDVYKENRKPTFTALQKRSIVTAVRQGTMTVVEAQAACGLKKAQSIREWLRAAKQENIDLSMRQNGDMNKKLE
jgi:transposase